MSDTPGGVPRRPAGRWDGGGMQSQWDSYARQRTAEQPAGDAAVAPVIMLIDRRPRVLLRRAAKAA